MSSAPAPAQASGAGSAPRPPRGGHDVLREAHKIYAADVAALARTSIETTNDLFELSDYVSRAESQARSSTCSQTWATPSSSETETWSFAPCGRSRTLA